MNRLDFFQKGFVNTMFSHPRLVENKINQYCGDTDNTFVFTPTELVVTMVKKPYLKPQPIQKYKFSLMSMDNGYTRIVDVEIAD